MTFVLTDLTPDVIIKAMEANFSQYHWPYAELPGGEIHFDPGCTWVNSGLPERWLNRVLQTHFEDIDLEEQVGKILKYFHERDLPMSWFIGPNTRPQTLSQALIAQGFSWIFDEPGMALDLLNMNDTSQPPDQFTIEVVQDQSAFQEWIDVWMTDVPEPTAQNYREVASTLGIGIARPWRYYLGRLGGKPVATLKLFFAAGIVSVHSVVTLQEARRMGIGTAIVIYALREAQNLGYRLAALTASSDGLPVYEKIGFRTYATFSNYSTLQLE